MKLNLIVAVCKNRGIGINNCLPWDYKCDLKLFSKITKGKCNNAIIMGRKTFDSIGRVLPDRMNIILSRQSIKTNIENVMYFTNLEEAILSCQTQNFDEAYIIGGASIYEEALKTKQIDSLHITEINKDFECDTFFPNISLEIFYEYSSEDLIKNEVVKKIYKRR